MPAVTTMDLQENSVRVSEINCGETSCCEQSKNSPRMRKSSPFRPGPNEPMSSLLSTGICVGASTSASETFWYSYDTLDAATLLLSSKGGAALVAPPPPSPPANSVAIEDCSVDTLDEDRNEGKEDEEDEDEKDEDDKNEGEKEEDEKVDEEEGKVEDEEERSAA